MTKQATDPDLVGQTETTNIQITALERRQQSSPDEKPWNDWVWPGWKPAHGTFIAYSQDYGTGGNVFNGWGETFLGVRLDVDKQRVWWQGYLNGYWDNPVFPLALTIFAPGVIPPEFRPAKKTRVIFGESGDDSRAGSRAGITEYDGWVGADGSMMMNPDSPKSEFFRAANSGRRTQALILNFSYRVDRT